MSVGRPVTEHRYGARADQLLDLHQATTGSPMVVAVHGGAWRTGDRSLMRTTAEALAARGVTVASIEYRQRQPDPVADMVADIGESVTWARSRTDGPVVVVGDSAGAHASLLGILTGEIPRIDGMVSLCGALDLTELSDPRDDDQVARFAEYRGTISGNASHPDTVLDRLDPARLRRERGMGAGLAPLFAATSSADFFQRSTLSYVQVAAELGDDVTVHAVGDAHPECRHSWQLDGSLPESARLFDAVAAWVFSIGR